MVLLPESLVEVNGMQLLSCAQDSGIFHSAVVFYPQPPGWVAFSVNLKKRERNKKVLTLNVNDLSDCTK